MSGQRFWRGPAELADGAAFHAAQDREFDLDRRALLRGFGASLALAGLAGCEMRPDDRARPYVTDPENEVPGKPGSTRRLFPSPG